MINKDAPDEAPSLYVNYESFCWIFLDSSPNHSLDVVSDQESALQPRWAGSAGQGSQS